MSGPGKLVVNSALDKHEIPQNAQYGMKHKIFMDAIAINKTIEIL